MKQIKEKLKRLAKYWHVRYKQASGRDRLFAGMYTLMVLVYAWWMILVL